MISGNSDDLGYYNIYSGDDQICVVSVFAQEVFWYDSREIAGVNDKACWTYARALMMVMMTTRVTESASDDDTDYRPVISTKKCRLVKDSFKMHLEDARKRYSLKVPSRYKIMTTV